MRWSSETALSVLRATSALRRHAVLTAAALAGVVGLCGTALANEAPSGESTGKSAPAPLGNQVSTARARWVSECWNTADAATRKPGRYIAVLAFDGAGKLVIAGLNEVRGSSDPNIAQCIRPKLTDFTVPATGAPSTVEMPFDIP